MVRRILGVSVGWIGISMIADGVPALLLPHRLLEDGADATAIGLTSLVAIGVAALLQPVAGWASDRIGRRPIIALGAAVAIVGLALLVTPGMAVPGAVLALSGVSVAQAGHQALLPDRVAAGWRGRAGGLKSAFDVGGAFLGFLVLGFLLGAGNEGTAAVTLAVVLIAAFVAGRLLLADEPNGAPVSRPRGGGRVAAPDRAFVAVVVARFCFLLGIYVVGRFLLVHVGRQLGLDADAAAEQAGFVLAILAAVTVAASVPSGWLADRLGRRPIMLVGGALAAAGTALLASADGIGWLVASGALMAVGSAAFGSASWATLADLAARVGAGRLLGIANLGTAGAAALAGAFGPLVGALGTGPAFSIAAAFTLAGGLVAWRSPSTSTVSRAVTTPEAVA